MLHAGHCKSGIYAVLLRQSLPDLDAVYGTWDWLWQHVFSQCHKSTPAKLNKDQLAKLGLLSWPSHGKSEQLRYEVVVQTQPATSWHTVHAIQPATITSRPI